jgi:hypothetical protein
MLSFDPGAITLAPTAAVTASSTVVAEVVGALGSESTQNEKSLNTKYHIRR